MLEGTTQTGKVSVEQTSQNDSESIHEGSGTNRNLLPKVGS
jgi:hypothetical protein